LSPPTAAAQHTTAPIMIAATAPIGDSRPSSSINTTDANRMVAMVMPDTGLFDEPTNPARYADTDTNRKPAMIMMMVIRMPIAHGCETEGSAATIAWYSSASGSTNTTSAISIHFIGRSRSVSAMLASAPLRAAAMPLRTPDSNELRKENSVHTPPISIAPTPR